MEIPINRRSGYMPYLSPCIPILLFCLLTFFALPAQESVPPPEKTEEAPPPPPAPAEVLLDTVSAHLDAVKKESPVFYRQLERKMSGEKDHLAAQFLRTISPALTNPPAAKPRRKRETQPFYSCRLEENRILYLAPGILTPQAKTELKNILRKTIPQKTPLIGIILDLRDASGSDPLDGWNLFSLFSFGSEKEAIQREPVPILVLTDARTREAAEVLAKLLEHTRYGLCIGERTQGAPFPRRTIQSGGHSFSVPLIPEKLENLTPDALTPAISTAGAPRMSFSDLSKNKPVTKQSDPALNRARDLLLSLDTLNQKRRK